MPVSTSNSSRTSLIGSTTVIFGMADRTQSPTKMSYVGYLSNLVPHIFVINLKLVFNQLDVGNIIERQLDAYFSDFNFNDYRLNSCSSLGIRELACWII